MKSNTHKLLRRRYMALVLCFTLAFSSSIVSYANGETSENQTPPPELIIGEGEVWVPGAVDPLLLAPYGTGDSCSHDGYPSNYRYLGAVKGSTKADVQSVSLTTKIISVFVPAPFKYALKIANVLVKVSAEEEIQGEYIKYQYIYDFGPDSNMYWFHTVFEFATLKGVDIGEACYATYSPKKPGDPYQD